MFREFGHDMHSVYDEWPSGASDPTIYSACQREERCLWKSTSAVHLSMVVRRFLVAWQAGSIAGRLRVVEPGRIRVHAKTDESED